MKWKKFGAFLCVLGLVLLLPGPEPVRTAGAPAEVTLDSPPLVALTFDDGPRSSTTGPLLDGLALREVPATFFLVGNRIPGNEDLVRRMAAEGHQIGIHTYDHVELKGLSRQDFDLQVGKTRALITQLVGEGNYWLRPPYGLMDRQAGLRAAGQKRGELVRRAGDSVVGGPGGLEGRRHRPHRGRRGGARVRRGHHPPARSFPQLRPGRPAGGGHPAGPGLLLRHRGAADGRTGCYPGGGGAVQKNKLNFIKTIVIFPVIVYTGDNRFS